MRIAVNEILHDLIGDFDIETVEVHGTIAHLKIITTFTSWKKQIYSEAKLIAFVVLPGKHTQHSTVCIVS